MCPTPIVNIDLSPWCRRAPPPFLPFSCILKSNAPSVSCCGTFFIAVCLLCIFLNSTECRVRCFEPLWAECFHVFPVLWWPSTLMQCGKCYCSVGFFMFRALRLVGRKNGKVASGQTWMSLADDVLCLLFAESCCFFESPMETFVWRHVVLSSFTLPILCVSVPRVPLSFHFVRGSICQITGQPCLLPLPPSMFQPFVLRSVSATLDCDD